MNLIEVVVLFCVILLVSFSIYRMRKLPGFFKRTYLVCVDGSLGMDRLLAEPEFASYDVGTTQKFRVAVPERRMCPFEIHGIISPLSSEEIERRAGECGYYPANTEELLAFAKAFPKECRRYDIVALGSKTDIDHDPRVLCLTHEFFSPSLDIRHYKAHWPEKTAFLMLPKKCRPIRMG